MEPVNIIGVGMTKFGVLDDSILDLAKSAAFEAMEDSSTVEAHFDHLFVGKSIIVYKLLVEIMRINCFAFFELMGGGWSKITNTLGNQTN